MWAWIEDHVISGKPLEGPVNHFFLKRRRRIKSVDTFAIGLKTLQYTPVYSLHTTQTVKHGEGFIFGQNHPSSVEIKIGVGELRRK